MPDKNICRMLKDNGFCRYRKEKVNGAACSGPGRCKYYNTAEIIVEKKTETSKPKKPSKRGSRSQLNLAYESSNSVDTVFTVEDISFQNSTAVPNITFTYEELRRELESIAGNVYSSQA